MSSEKVKLCLATQHFYPTHGGAQLRFLRYLPGLINRGINAYVLTGTPKGKKAFDSESIGNWRQLAIGEFLPPTRLNGAPVYRVRLPEEGSLRRIFIFNRSISKFCTPPEHRPDVIQMVSSLQPPSVYWLKKLRETNLKLIYAYTLSAKVPTNILLKKFWQLSFRLLYNQFDAIIVSSDPTKKMIQSLGVRTRIVKIPNGVNLDRFKPIESQQQKIELKSAFGLSNEDLMISTVGAIHPRKGSDVLLAAWVSIARKFPNAHLFIVGLRKDLTYPNLKGFRKELVSLLRKSGAPDRVHMPGEVGNVEDYLKASDVFVFPSAREGMPNAVLEAMSTGLPVVMTPFMGLSSDLGEADHEYVMAQRNGDSLAHSIERLLKDQELSKRLGQHARKWVEKTMDVEKILDRYASLYHQIKNSSQTTPI
jgi:glycosyltransferase involved in cell wall biosynthesis